MSFVGPITILNLFLVIRYFIKGTDEYVKSRNDGSLVTCHIPKALGFEKVIDAAGIQKDIRDKREVTNENSESEEEGEGEDAEEHEEQDEDEDESNRQNESANTVVSV